MAEELTDSPQAFLPPRRPSQAHHSRESTPRNSATDLHIRTPPFLPPRQPSRRSSIVSSELRWSGSTEHGFSGFNDSQPTETEPPSRALSGFSKRASSTLLPEAGLPFDLPSREPSQLSRSSSLERSSKLQTLSEADEDHQDFSRPIPRRTAILRNSSLRHESKLQGDNLGLPDKRSSCSALIDRDQPYGGRPLSYALGATLDVPRGLARSASLSSIRERFTSPKDMDMPSSLPASGTTTPVVGPRPRASFSRLSSLDNLMLYREEKAEWKRASSILQYAPSESFMEYHDSATATVPTTPTSPTGYAQPDTVLTMKAEGPVSTTEREVPAMSGNKFRHFVAEILFCFTIAMTQFLAEYLISGFAIELPKIFSSMLAVGPGDTGEFWPASLLSLILSATLLIFARISDLYGGYLPFMFGLVWLTIWTLVPGLTSSLLVLDVSRAMQGLAIAAFTPATFAMVGSIYPEGPRRNVVLGLYGACAPLGFYAGFLTGGALPACDTKWYFFIAAILSFTTAFTAYLCVPTDRTDRQRLGLKMDWIGAFLITSGLILVAYGLAVEPYAPSNTGWRSAMVLGPFVSGIACLALAVWVEGWYAECPLFPFEFFRPRGIKPFSLACLFFYGSFGVWLYNSAQFFATPGVATKTSGIGGIALSLWYTPMAVGGIVFCIVGGSLLHIVPIKLLLILSGLAWVGAPLIFAVGPLPLNYWSEVMPSMVCGTLGIDLTFTISTIVLSSSQPLRYQGLAGAVSSILVNLGMSFSLPISQIVKAGASSRYQPAPGTHGPQVQADLMRSSVWQLQAAFIYAAASAGVGLFICIFFVRISRSVVRARPEVVDEEAPRATSSEAPTLVEKGVQDAHLRQ